MGSRKKSVGIVATAIIVISLVGKVIGFFRELLLANYFGTSSIVDVYLMSLTIPSIFFGFLPAIGVGFTPVYYEIEDDDRKNRFINNILITSIFISLVCIALTFAGSKYLVRLCAPGFSKSAKNMTAEFLRITVWTVLFNTPVQIFIAFLNCKKDYINSNLSNLTVSFTQAIFVVIAAHTNPVFLPIGAIIPWIFQFFWLFFSSYRQGFRPSIKVTKDEYVTKLLVLSAPICISNLLVDLNGFVDKTLSSALPEGRLSALNYSFTLRALFVTIASTVISTIFYPRISELVSSGSKNEVSELVGKLLDLLLIFIIPVNVFCYIFGKEEIQLVLMRGNFNSESLSITLTPFRMYMISLSFIVVRELIIKVMYANGDTKKNLYFGALDIGINIVLSLLFVKPMEHGGLALATSIAAIITFPLYIIELVKMLPEIRLRHRIAVMFKILVSSIIMGGISIALSWILQSVFSNSFFPTLCRLGICFIIGLGTYLLMLKVFKIEEIAIVFSKINGKVRQKRNV